MMNYYKLDKDKNVVPADRRDPDFNKLWEADYRRVAEDTVGNIWVSTVFLPMDHRFGQKWPPIVFETMAFDVSGQKQAGRIGDDLYQERCSTWAEAVEMHKLVVQMVKDGRIKEQADDIGGVV